MKKLIYICIAFVAINIVSCKDDAIKAQTSSFYNMLTTDTVINTGTVNLDAEVSNSWSVASFQVIATEVSGTSDGTCLLQAGNDGTNFKDISTDTLQIADVATQSFLWAVTSVPYRHYRITCTGVGTMSNIVAGKAAFRREW